MKKKRLILILTALLFALPSMTWAQNVEQQLVVWQKNGDKVRYDLAELPETSFENGLLIITTSKTTEKYQLATKEMVYNTGEKDDDAGITLFFK